MVEDLGLTGTEYNTVLSFFFITYILTTGFSGAGGAFLQVAPLILHYIKKWLFGRTPRQAFSASFVMPTVRRDLAVF